MYSLLGLKDEETEKEQIIGFATSKIADGLYQGMQKARLTFGETVYQTVINESGNLTFDKEDFLKFYKEARNFEKEQTNIEQERINIEVSRADNGLNIQGRSELNLIKKMHYDNLNKMFNNSGFGEAATDKFLDETNGPYELYSIEKDGTELINV